MAQKKVVPDTKNLDSNPISQVNDGNLADSSIGVNSDLKAISMQLKSMMSLFEAASDDLSTESNDFSSISAKLNPLSDKLDRMFEQNNQIAQGMVTIIEMLEEEKKLRDLQFREISSKLKLSQSQNIPKSMPNNLPNNIPNNIPNKFAEVDKFSSDRAMPSMNNNLDMQDPFFTNKPPVTPSGMPAMGELNNNNNNNNNLRQEKVLSTPLHNMPPIDPFVNDQSTLTKATLTPKDSAPNMPRNNLANNSMNTSQSTGLPRPPFGKTSSNQKKPQKSIFSGLFKK